MPELIEKLALINLGDEGTGYQQQNNGSADFIKLSQQAPWKTRRHNKSYRYWNTTWNLDDILQNTNVKQNKTVERDDNKRDLSNCNAHFHQPIKTLQEYSP